MAKRKTFYVNAAIFDGSHSAYAVAVFAYLSYCADKSGSCFPSMSAIGRHCGITRNTVKKALDELGLCGLVRSESAHRLSKNGRMLRCANRYALAAVSDPAHETTVPLSRDDPPHAHEVTVPPSRDDPPPAHEVTVPPSRDAQEINNNSKSIIDDVPSVAVSLSCMRDGTDLDAILDRLYLHLFDDRVFASAIEQTIRRMYYAPYTKIDGERIENGTVRARLRLLTVDHIDFVEKQIDEREGEITNGERYLAACIYHAPIDCTVKTARDRNAI